MEKMEAAVDREGMCVYICVCVRETERKKGASLRQFLN